MKREHMIFVPLLSVHHLLTFWARERLLELLFVRWAGEMSMQIRENLATKLAPPEWTVRIRQVSLSIGKPLVQVLIGRGIPTFPAGNRPGVVGVGSRQMAGEHVRRTFPSIEATDRFSHRSWSEVWAMESCAVAGPCLRTYDFAILPTYSTSWTPEWARKRKFVSVTLRGMPREVEGIGK